MDSTQSTGCVPYTAGACVTPGGDPNNDGCRHCAGLLDQCQDTGLPPPSYKVSTYGACGSAVQRHHGCADAPCAQAF